MKCRFITQLLYLAGLFSPVAGNAQAPDLEERMHVTFSAAPEYAYRYLNGATDMKGFIKQRNTEEKSLLGNNFGMGFSYAFTDKFGIETGIYNWRKGYSIPHVLRFTNLSAPPINNSTGKQIYKYVEIPIKGIYFIKAGDNILALKAGITVGKCYKSVFKNEWTENGKTRSTVGNSKMPDNKIASSAYFGFHISQKIKNNLHVFAEPHASVNLNKQYNAPIKQYLWCLGANLGLAYAFN